MNIAAGIGRSSVSKSTRFSLSGEMMRLTQDGTVKAFSRD